jgi:hypothetical protein
VWCRKTLQRAGSFRATKRHPVSKLLFLRYKMIAGAIIACTPSRSNFDLSRWGHDDEIVEDRVGGWFGGSCRRGAGGTDRPRQRVDLRHGAGHHLDAGGELLRHQPGRPELHPRGRGCQRADDLERGGSWADNLVYAGCDDWRLPTLGPIGAAFDYDFSTNATTDVGYADSAGWVNGLGVPVSEMGHMYYVNLANLGFCPPDGGDGDPSTCDNAPQPGWGLNNTSFIDALTGDTVSFLHVQPGFYWSGLGYAPNPNFAWYFNFLRGGQGALDKGLDGYAWAVRPGDVAAAPLPGTAVLMALGLLGLGAGRRVRRAT